jgi:hypothetical protein
MSACCSISKLNFAGLNSLEEIGTLVFVNCTNIRDITIRGVDMPRLTRIGDFLFIGALRLCNLTFVDIPNLRSIGEYMIEDCPNFDTLDLSGAYNVTELSGYLIPTDTNIIRQIKYILPDNISPSKNYLSYILPEIAITRGIMLVTKKEVSEPKN